MVRRGVGVALLLLAACPVRLADAQTPKAKPAEVAEAKRLFEQGVALLQAEQWSAAEARFRRSVELVPRASALYNLALALFSQHRYAECATTTERLLALADPVEREAYRHYAELLKARALAAAEAAGTHTSEPVGGARPSEARVSAQGPTREVGGALTGPQPLAANDALRPRARVLPEPRPAPQAAATDDGGVSGALRSPSGHDLRSAWVQRDRAARQPDAGLAPAWYVIGAGALVLAGAVVTGVLASSADADFSEACPGARDCDPGLKPLAVRTRRLALATDLLLAIGVATLGTGVSLWLIDDGDARARGPAREHSRAIGLLYQGRVR